MPLSKEELFRWTGNLKANPQDRCIGSLQSPSDSSKNCCLGRLAVLQRIPFEATEKLTASSLTIFKFPIGDSYVERGDFLAGDLAAKFGSMTGNFKDLEMPMLRYPMTSGEFGIHASASLANDEGVPWPIIAEHFEKYYAYEGKDTK